VMAAHAIERLPAAIGGIPASLPSEGVEQPDARWKSVLGLRCDLTVDLPIPKFQIGDLLKLRKGSVINAHWRVGQDVPLSLNGTRIGWIEFEIISGHLAVRLTELA
jgi:flagellar motor switch/type III secretory pathway protein FliN